jgi:hypothetical protein
MSERAVYKSTSAEYLDELFGGSGEQLEQAYQEALDRMAGLEGAPLAEAASQLVEKGDLPSEAVKNSTTGWRAGSEVDRVLGCAYREAIELARSHPKPVPIDTLWVTGAGDDFEVHICDGERHVTVVMFIPLTREYGSKRAKARSWVVRAAGDGEPENARVFDEGDTRVAMVQVSGKAANKR